MSSPALDRSLLQDDIASTKIKKDKRSLGFELEWWNVNVRLRPTGRLTDAEESEHEGFESRRLEGRGGGGGGDHWLKGRPIGKPRRQPANGAMAITHFAPHRQHNTFGV
ncbi:unnamed protein product [Pleuronectes platessa]|uniref:Uncharacterized protein n=1 Tax=Pleuronectes platessa TaxID=8262 RepID=A0A9N7VD78_PLEPL|nr:unnamed protein product [Pleuronectes platessa]